MDPDFLLRVHRAPIVAGTYRLSDLDVASRLSFFLWSSIPDDRLLTLAERGQLTNSPTLEKEVRRMLADPRASDALVNDFAAQWLNLRRVEEVVVDPDRYPNYDESLLQAFKQETGDVCGQHAARGSQRWLICCDANYTFVNETAGAALWDSGNLRETASGESRCRITSSAARGLLAQGALLATTSYPDRTSPVLRGKWLLNNIFDLPIPPPPPGVDTNLVNKPGATPASMRERLAQHRQSASCNNCQFRNRSIGIRAGEFRCDRRVADGGRIRQGGGCERGDVQRREGRGASGIAVAAAGSA